MRLLTAILAVVAAICTCMPSVHAGVMVSHMQFGANAQVYSGSSAKGSFSESSTNGLNSSLTSVNGISLGFRQTLGNNNYQYSAGNTFSSSGNHVDISVFSHMDVNADSRSAPAASSFEAAYSYVDFKLDQQYTGSLQLTGLLSQTLSKSYSFLNLYGYLYSSNSGFTKVLSITNNNSGASTASALGYLPTTVVLGPGDYQLYIAVDGGRNGSYNLPALSMNGVASLSLNAVAEPVSMLVWGGIAATACVPRFRKLIKLRRSRS